MTAAMQRMEPGDPRAKAIEAAMASRLHPAAVMSEEDIQWLLDAYRDEQTLARDGNNFQTDGQ